MTDLIIRDLPDELHRKLSRHAKQNRRSVAKEALILQERALDTREQKSVVLPQPFTGRFFITDEWLEQAKRNE